MRSTIVALIILPIAGLSLGAGGATLLWSQMLSHSHARQADLFRIIKDWEVVAKKHETNAATFEAIARKNEAGWRECLQIASNGQLGRVHN